MTELAEALGARGLVCVVGAGGKKSTLYRLATDLHQAILTATVRIPIFDDHVGQVILTDDPLAAVYDQDEQASGGITGETRGRGEATAETGSPRWPLGIVPAREGNDRYRGYDPTTVANLADAVSQPVLVKADGARTRWLKAPGTDEPRLPVNADLVVPVVSARVVGRSIDERKVHRPERVVRLLGAGIGDELNAVDVAQVVVHPEGGLARVPESARVVALVNMVDTPELARTGRAIAQAIHHHGDVEKVVLTRLLDPSPVVDVIERPE